MKHSFHARFTRPALVSHFMPIPVKRETKDHFISLLPMTDLGKRTKRDPAKIQALVSRETALVSHHFTVRFMPSTRYREQTSGQALFVRSRYCFGACDATIFSKRGSPRSRSQSSSSLRVP